ncbi:hypothetical protein RI367_005807 [Sorochytrium milnesiophthora]
MSQTRRAATTARRSTGRTLDRQSAQGGGSMRLAVSIHCNPPRRLLVVADPWWTVRELRSRLRSDFQALYGSTLPDTIAVKNDSLFDLSPNAQLCLLLEGTSPTIHVYLSHDDAPTIDTIPGEATANESMLSMATLASAKRKRSRNASFTSPDYHTGYEDGVHSVLYGNRPADRSISPVYKRRRTYPTRSPPSRRYESDQSHLSDGDMLFSPVLDSELGYADADAQRRHVPAPAPASQQSEGSAPLSPELRFTPPVAMDEVPVLAPLDLDATELAAQEAPSPAPSEHGQEVDQVESDGDATPPISQNRKHTVELLQTPANNDVARPVNETESEAKAQASSSSSSSSEEEEEDGREQPAIEAASNVAKDESEDDDDEEEEEEEEGTDNSDTSSDSDDDHSAKDRTISVRKEAVASQRASPEPTSATVSGTAAAPEPVSVDPDVVDVTDQPDDDATQVSPDTTSTEREVISISGSDDDDDDGSEPESKSPQKKSSDTESASEVDAPAPSQTVNQLALRKQTPPEPGRLPAVGTFTSPVKPTPPPQKPRADVTPQPSIRQIRKLQPSIAPAATPKSAVRGTPSFSSIMKPQSNRQPARQGLSSMLQSQKHLESVSTSTTPSIAAQRFQAVGMGITTPADSPSDADSSDDEGGDSSDSSSSDGDDEGDKDAKNKPKITLAKSSGSGGSSALALLAKEQTKQDAASAASSPGLPARSAPPPATKAPAVFSAMRASVANAAKSAVANRGRGGGNAIKLSAKQAASTSSQRMNAHAGDSN